MGDHSAALRLLALTMADVRAAEAFCEATAGEEGYRALLDMLLRPGEGRAPLFAEACHLLANSSAVVSFHDVAVRSERFQLLCNRC